MHTSLFFKLFPPPKFLVMRHVGLDISEDSIHCLEYSSEFNRKITKYASIDLPEGIIEDGEIKKEKDLTDILSKLQKDKDLSYAKVSVPEEKAYLFQTDISTTNPVAIAQNIEFKLEENVPLPVSEALFYFDILPMAVTEGKLRASVSVVPRTYIEKIVSILRNSNISPIAFEVVPKAIARATLSPSLSSTVMIIQIMNHKTGVYVVSGGVVCFTFTVGWGNQKQNPENKGSGLIIEEIKRIYEYWSAHNPETSKIAQIVMVGRGSLLHEEEINSVATSLGISASIGNVWNNVFSLDKYIPPIKKDDSLDYSVSAGLAMDL